MKVAHSFLLTMKELLFLLGLIACAHGFSIPVKVLVQTTKEAPEVASATATALWTAPVTVGTPGQTFQLAIDTWGVYLWVPDMSCSGCIGKKLYNQYKSSSYHTDGYTMNINDHLGKATGQLATDIFVLGSIANKSTVFTGNFGQAYTIPSVIANAPGVDGVLGIAGAYPNTFADHAYDQEAWNKDVMTYWLENNNETSDKGTHGVIYYGNYDPLHCNFSYSVPRTDVVAYKFLSTQFFVYQNGKKIVSSLQNRQAIVDSTSPYIKVPQNLATQILTALGLPSNTPLPASVPCATINSLQFSFANSKGTENIKGLNLNLPQQNGKCQLAMTVAAPMGGEGATGHFELGIPFFRGRCTYFDRSLNTIGFGWPGVRVPGGKK